jgi:hypothetical protein
MKIKKMVEQEFEAKFLTCKIGVRYWEDSSVNGIEDTNGDLIPCRIRDLWCPEIDVESGKILNWKIGTSASLHYKVCDQGIYTLRDHAGVVIHEIDGYVPKLMCPKENGYGDYIVMDIDENGQIQNWTPNLKDFIED